MKGDALRRRMQMKLLHFPCIITEWSYGNVQSKFHLWNHFLFWLPHLGKETIYSLKTSKRRAHLQNPENPEGSSSMFLCLFSPWMYRELHFKSSEMEMFLRLPVTETPENLKHSPWRIISKVSTTQKAI